MEKELIKQKVEEFFIECNVPEEHKKGYSYHIDRFYITLELLRKSNISGKVLEIGGYDAISKLIREEFPNCEYINTDCELREALPYPDNSFDYIINTEVLEHIGEVDVPRRQAFSFYGATNLLKECYRVLKTDCRMFLSTPNVASYVVLEKMLFGMPPWFYYLHFKEYTVPEIQFFLKNTGFKVNYITTAFTCVPEAYFSNIKKFLADSGYSTVDRGDIILSEVTK